MISSKSRIQFGIICLAVVVQQQDGASCQKVHTLPLTTLFITVYITNFS